MKKIDKLHRRGVRNGGSLIWNESVLEALGSMPDADLAELAGCKKYSIYRKRMELGIPRWKKDWSPEDIGLLGTDTDARVGDRIGRSQPAVCNKRRELGIPKYNAKIEAKHLKKRDIKYILSTLDDIEKSIKSIRTFLQASSKEE